MPNQKLNDQFRSCFPFFKLSLFFIFWFWISKSLFLALFYLALSPLRTLNETWSENLWFISSFSLWTSLFFFREDWSIKAWIHSIQREWIQILESFLYLFLLIAGLVLSHRLEFLGVSPRSTLAFWSSYSWSLQVLVFLVHWMSLELWRQVLFKRMSGSPLIQTFLHFIILAAF